MREIERLTATNLSFTQANHKGQSLLEGQAPKRSPNKSSLYNVKQNKRLARWLTTNLFLNDFGALNTSSRQPTRKVGGAGRDRTDDILLAKQALSQLSYGP